MFEFILAVSCFGALCGLAAYHFGKAAGIDKALKTIPAPKQEEKEVRRNFEAVGMKVIIRSNEDEPYVVGEIIRTESFGQSSQYIPIVKVGDRELTCFSNILPYSTLMCQVMNGMSPKEQWDFSCELRRGLRDIDRIGKERHEV